MKKHLIALAALTAFAGAASAQSSVTLFGVVDLNGRWLNNNGATQYQLAQGGLAASRLGFRGSEDLGGGMRAEFWLEAALDPDTGTIGVTSINGDRNNAAALFTRRSTASLLGGWGEVRLGRDQTATYLNTPVFDPFGDNGLGAASHLTTKPPAVPVGGGYDTLARANNMVAYFLPSGIAGGLYGLVQAATGENVYGNKFFGGRVGYAAGPFNAALAYGAARRSTPTPTATTSTSALRGASAS